MRRKQKGRKIRELTERRVSYLHGLSVATARRNSALSSRYIDMMERIGRRMDYTLPARIKRSYCKKCKTPYAGNARIRIKKKTVQVTCGNCGDVRRIPS